jgi:hypothetical protein
MKKSLKIRYEKEVTEFEFWKYYFENYNINKSKKEKFTEFELSTIACMMCEDYHKSPLKNKQRLDLVEKLNKLGYDLKIQNVHTRIVKPLLTAGILYKSEDDERPGEYSINPKLKQIQFYIKDNLKNNTPVELSIYHNIKINGTS